MRDKINLTPDASNYPPATQVTPEQIETAEGTEKQKLAEKQLAQLRDIHLKNFMERMKR